MVLLRCSHGQLAWSFALVASAATDRLEWAALAGDTS